MPQSQLLEQAWQSYNKQLLSYIQSRVSIYEDAEDILNNVFVKLAAMQDRGDAPQDVLKWLYRVTKNTVIDYYRVRKPAYELPDDLVEEATEKLAAEQLSSCVTPMIEMLPKEYSLPLLLCDIQGRKQQEVADEMNISLSALKSRVLRGREKLKELVAACCAVEKNRHGRIVDYERISKEHCGC